MKLLYKKIYFDILFKTPVDFNNPPAFTFRSIIGYQLRKMCCVSHSPSCDACQFHASCVYGTAFESIVSKTNTIAAGRDRLSHPVIIDSDIMEVKQISQMRLGLIFMGPALQSLPYFYFALLKGGEAGVLKQRIPYNITDVRVGDISILINADKLDVEHIRPDCWEFNTEDTLAALTKKIMIKLISPLRFKVQGRYTDRFSAADFALCLHRRARTLCTEYGSSDLDALSRWTHQGKWDIVGKSLVWKDWEHYSARQKKAMRLGGVLGNLVLQGEFSAYEYALLQFAEIFHAGKNTIFGLGKLELWEMNL
jgi:hypothetical protein